MDVLREPPREPGSKETPPRDPKELPGYELQLVMRAGEGPPPGKAPEVNAAAIEAARRKTEPHVLVDFSPTRARFVLTGGFVVPSGTELRARTDRYGHLLVWPGQSAYRVVEPGAVRALLAEGRLDVAPLSPVGIATGGEGARRLGARTRRVDVTTRAAKATLELASVRDAGDGGALVCRLVLDLIGAPPTTDPCGNDEVPLHAELRWTTQGSLVLDAVSLTRRGDLAVADLAAPPPTLFFVPDPPPRPPGEALVGKTELASFRNAPVEVPPPPDAQAVPDSGLILVNSGDMLRVAWLDGVAVAWVAPGGRVSLPSLVRGRYTLQWRTFLGDAWEMPQTAVVPGRIESQ